MLRFPRNRVGLIITLCVLVVRVIAGTVSEHLFSFWDFLPTALDIAAIPKEEWPRTDGISALPTLEHSGAIQPMHRYLYYEFCFYKVSPY